MTLKERKKAIIGQTKEDAEKSETTSRHVMGWKKYTQAVGYLVYIYNVGTQHILIVFVKT